jgi:hypothetical protein
MTRTSFVEFALLGLGILIIPAICLAYLFLRLPARREQLTSLFKSDGILPKYLAAREHLPPRDPSGTDEDYHERLTNVFDRIFAVDFRQEYGLALYAIPMLLAWLSTAVVVSYLVNEAFGKSAFPSELTAVRCGVFGAFVWSLWYLINRYLVTNLAPSILWWIPFRYIVAIAYGAFARMIFNDSFANLGAFALALIPITEAFDFIRKRLSPLGLSATDEQASGFKYIQGVDGATIETLADLGVLNTQQLANSDPLRLLMRSNFTPNVLIDWMDQCFMYNYIGAKIELLRCRGLRGGIEVAALQEVKDPKKEELVSAIAVQLGTAPAEVDNLITNFFLDKQLQLLWGLWGST